MVHLQLESVLNKLGFLNLLLDLIRILLTHAEVVLVEIRQIKMTANDNISNQSGNTKSKAYFRGNFIITQLRSQN